MKNVVTKVTGHILTITVDLSITFGPSKSGKTIIISSTEGNISIDDGAGAIMGLNIYKRA
jgi:hypothetical protein